MSKGMWETAFRKKREGEPDGPGMVEEDGDDLLFVDHRASMEGPPSAQAAQDGEAPVDPSALAGNHAALREEGADDTHRVPQAALSEEKPSAPAWEGTFLEMSGTSEDGVSGPALPAGGPQVQLLVGPTFASGGEERTPPTLTKMNPSLNSIWTSLLMKSSAAPRTVLFCGATQGEGVSFISFHFSLFLALGLHLQVLFLDTDVEKRSPCPYLPPLAEGRGLVSFFDEGLPLLSLVAGTQFENLWVLPAGTRHSSTHPQGFVYRKETLLDLVSFCQRHFDVAIFDGQPVLWSPATVAFARAVNRVMLICRYGFSRREVSKLAIDTLQENAVEVAGVILNDRQYPIPQRLYKKLK